MLLLPCGAASLQPTEPSVARTRVLALLTAALRRLAAALQLPPAAWGATLLLLPGGVGVGAAAACSPAMLQPAGKISFSPCPFDFPIPRRRSLSSFIPSVLDSATVAVYV